MKASKRPEMTPPTRPAVAMAFGEVLRSARKQKGGLSQEQLAELANMDPAYPSLLERGLRSPTLFMVIHIAVALGSRPGTIVDDVMARLPS